MLFSGSSHRELATKIAECLGIRLGKVAIERFPDGEIGVQILENVRGRDLFIVQSIARHPNLYLMELLILVDALKRASAKSIVTVIPYFGYARQDRKDKGRVPITAKLVANLLEKAGVTRVLTMDLHSEQIQGFFDIPVDNLYAAPLLAEAVRELSQNFVVVAPDVGSSKRARAFATELRVDMAIVEKRRLSSEEVEMRTLIGSVKGCDVILVDDMCSTGGTLKSASWVCKSEGAKSIYAAVTHGLLVGNGFKESAIEKLFITDTIPQGEDYPKGRIEEISVAKLFADAILSIVANESISALYRSRI